MCVLLSVFYLIIGISLIIYSHKNRTSIDKNIWDAIMSYRGYLGGILFVVISLVNFYKC